MRVALPSDVTAMERSVLKIAESVEKPQMRDYTPEQRKATLDPAID
jgi:hypothetical protein